MSGVWRYNFKIPSKEFTSHFLFSWIKAIIYSGHVKCYYSLSEPQNRRYFKPSKEIKKKEVMCWADSGGNQFLICVHKHSTVIHVTRQAREMILESPWIPESGMLDFSMSIAPFKNVAILKFTNYLSYHPSSSYLSRCSSLYNSVADINK